MPPNWASPRAAPGHVAGFARRVAQAAIDLLFPPACLGCGRQMGVHGGACAACWGRLRLIERPFCPIYGTPFALDLGPGILSPEAIAYPPVFDRLRSVAHHDGLARQLVHGLKYRDRTDLAPVMAEWMLRASDGEVARAEAIVAVPLHALRLASRRFNQSAELARAVARLSGKPFLADALRRSRRTRRQVGLGQRQRVENVRGAFTVTQEGRAEIFGRRLVLIDDVYTTGATVSAVTRALKKAGATEVTVLTFARALGDPI
ncbi:amidophosphoribosyltransferase [Rhizobium rhizosphaerae]|uniref:Amidophosphoribosyltransferase n=1 Tax=Xaviernesmea rhizosphaerae TaxID=1672749 RepID=A0A1Q9AFI3_9HYPH|nr:ComF family protein [Xaviernesmea rhizosphaerae]OLP53729.1 amidophosphoribosyltransferase [Xaviernesmea rhizosphaerae]